MCYDLAHQIRWAKHTFSGQCDITPMVCCSFGGHNTPQFLRCALREKQSSKSYHKQYYREHKYSLISKMKQYNEQNSEGLAHKRKLLYAKYRQKICMQKRMRHHGNIGHVKLVVLKRTRKHYARNRARICANNRHRYNLSDSKPFAKHQYVLAAKKALLGDTVVMRKLIVF